ncbi:MAG: heme-binding protein [Gelidibacter sp.]
MKLSKSMCIVLFSIMASGLSAQDVDQSYNLNQAGALKLAENAKLEAANINKNVSVAVLNTSGVTLLLLKGDDVGPHNSEASRRKAYTSVSTKTASFDLMNSAAASKDAQNLNTLPELLLLGGGVPIYKDDQLIGSLGVSGGGGSENDHNIAIKAVERSGFKVKK